MNGGSRIWGRLQEVTASPLRVRDPKSDIVFVSIEPGVFVQGSPEGIGAAIEHPQCRRGFPKCPLLAETPVTVGQWQRFVDTTGYLSDVERFATTGFTLTESGEWVRDSNACWREPLPRMVFTPSSSHPVTQVSWFDAAIYCSYFGLSLPSEAFWEFACRAGETTKYWWGEDASGAMGRANVLDESARRAWSGPPGFPFDDGFPFTSPVKHHSCNPWGLHDMLGNVWEWCLDGFGSGDYTQLDEVAPVCLAPGRRVIRGGSWFNGPGYVRCATRGRVLPSVSHALIGFRPVLEVRE